MKINELSHQLVKIIIKQQNKHKNKELKMKSYINIISNRKNRTDEILKCWFLKKTGKSNKRRKKVTKKTRNEKEAITKDTEKNIFNYNYI